MVIKSVYITNYEIIKIMGYNSILYCLNSTPYYFREMQALNCAWYRNVYIIPTTYRGYHQL